jgi:methionyl-tRNA formyltransferase
LLQGKVTIDKEETSVELLDRLAQLAPDVLSRTLNELESIPARPQNDAEATFAPILKREDGEIDWRTTATEIADRVRGFQPFPTAFTFHGGKRITFWRAAAQSDAGENTNIPGAIIVARGDELLIACGRGSVLQISELQAEGRQRLPVREFLNGVKLAVGDVLG